MTETKAPSPLFKVVDRVTGVFIAGTQEFTGRLEEFVEYQGVMVALLRCENGCDRPYVHVDSLRPSPAQPVEPKVGETWETNTIYLPRQMTITRIGRDEDYPYIYEEGNGVTASYCRRQLTRRLSPQPTASNARHCDKCMNPVSEGTLCGEHVRSLGKPRDPYREPVSKKMTDAEYTEWSLDQDRRHAAMRAKLEQTKADLDRPITRGRHDWDADDAPELYST